MRTETALFANILFFDIQWLILAPWNPPYWIIWVFKPLRKTTCPRIDECKASCGNVATCSRTTGDLVGSSCIMINISWPIISCPTIISIIEILNNNHLFLEIEVGRRRILPMWHKILSITMSYHEERFICWEVRSKSINCWQILRKTYMLWPLRIMKMLPTSI